MNARIIGFVPGSHGVDVGFVPACSVDVGLEANYGEHGLTEALPDLILSTYTDICTCFTDKE